MSKVIRQNDEGVLRQYFEAKPNKMFSALTTACIRFVRYQESVPCVLCGKRSKNHWTCVVRFKAANLGMTRMVVTLGRNYLKAGAPVCRDHPTQPDEREFLRKVRQAAKAQVKEAKG